jgi:hypothetical protein
LRENTGPAWRRSLVIEAHYDADRQHSTIYRSDMQRLRALVSLCFEYRYRILDWVTVSAFALYVLVFLQSYPQS